MFYLSVHSEDPINEEFFAVSTEGLRSQVYGKNDLIYNLHIGDVNNEFTTKLLQNTPNPFNNTTVIEFDLGSESEITLNIYDNNGQLVREITDNYKKGRNRVEIDGKSLNGSGIYYYQLKTEHYSGIKKMILID